MRMVAEEKEKRGWLQDILEVDLTEFIDGQ